MVFFGRGKTMIKASIYNFKRVFAASAILMIIIGLGGYVFAQQPPELAPDDDEAAIEWRRELYQRLEAHRRAVSLAMAQRKRIFARTWNISRFDSDFDSQWQGAIVASDGNLYFAVSSHSLRRGGAVFRLDVQTGEIRQLCNDISRICGEDPTRQTPQGLLPTQAFEVNGVVYWGTHFSAASPNAMMNYSGGYVVGYDIENDEWRNLGIIRENYAIDAISADEQRNRLYITVSPLPHNAGRASYLYGIDLENKDKRNLGVIGYGGYYRAIWVDREGNCWIGGNAGSLLKYILADGEIEGFPNALPYLRTDMGFTDGNAANQTQRSMNWARRTPGGNMAIFTMYGGVGLYTFDPRNIGGRWGSGFQWVTDIGVTGMGAALGGERFYFIKETSVPGEDFQLLHLHSIDYTGRTRRGIVDHGAIRDNDGRVPVTIHSMALGEGDRLYIIGEWITRDGDSTIMDYDEAGRRIPWGTAIMLGEIRLTDRD